MTVFIQCVGGERRSSYYTIYYVFVFLKINICPLGVLNCPSERENIDKTLINDKYFEYYKAFQIGKINSD
jgi:hypothetical protein